MAPLIAILAVWLPLVSYHRIAAPPVSEEAVARARTTPSDSVLAELSRHSIGVDPGWSDDETLVEAAELMIRGRVGFPGVPEAELSTPYSSADSGGLGLTLFLASLAVPNTLVRAYEITGDDRYLRAARDAIEAFARYERSAWIPRGLVWNDHAIAGRVLVLSRFWRHYRMSPSYEDGFARLVLQAAARSGSFLSSPEHFTYATNHGVMQNLALWHLAVSFPSLPDARQYRQLAYARLAQQFSFLIDEQGVILEHSPGYQKWGLDLLELTFRYAEMLELLPPADWQVKYHRALDFYRQLRRPDGSLPLIGDTRGGSYLPADSVRAPFSTARPTAVPNGSTSRALSDHLYATAGYLLWWDTDVTAPTVTHGAQTVLTWSHFAGHGHKHADELSLSLWADGQTWWTNVGYWPYGTPDRGLAESWSGSNAPHRIGEAWGHPRESRLLGHASVGGVRMADMLRETADGLRVRRQVVHPSPTEWIVVDFLSDRATQGARTVWTTWPNVRVDAGADSTSFWLVSPDALSRLHVTVLGSPDLELSLLSGSRAPFAGWTVIGHDVTPTASLVVDQPSQDSWSVYVWSLSAGPHSEGTQAVNKPSFTSADEDRWRLAYHQDGVECEISRAGPLLSVGDGCRSLSGAIDVELTEGAEANASELEHRLREVASLYPRFRVELPLRYRLSYLFIAAFLAQELTLLTSYLFARRLYPLLTMGAVVCWCLGGVFLYLRYV